MIKKLILILAVITLGIALFGCGGGNSGSSLPEGVNPGVVSRVELMATSYVNQTNGYCYLKTKAIDGNGVPIPSRQVVWTNLSTTGVLDTTTSMTNQNGIATATLYSTTAGFATIQAEVNADNTGTEKIRDRKTVYFSLFDMSIPQPAAAPDLSSLTLTSDNYILFETPTDTDANITATVTDSNGQPGFNRVVTFGSDSPAITFPFGSPTNAPVVHTNAAGKAVVLARVTPTLLTTADTMVNITASAVTDTKTIPAVLSLFLKPVTINTITVTANPSTIPSAGTSAISAKVATTAGTPPPTGTAVNFSVSAGNITPFSATDATGLAAATLTAPIVTTGTKTVNITAAAGGKTGQGSVLVTTAATLTVIPDTQTIGNPAVGNTAQYTIFGGTAPYTAFSAKPDLVQVAISGNIVTAMVASVPAVDTTVTISIFDALGATKNVTLILDVPPVVALTVVPKTQTIGNPAVGNTAHYSVTGGTAPYSAFSSNPALVQVSISGNTVTAMVASVPSADTTVTISVYDAAGATTDVTLKLTVLPVVPLTVIPDAQTIGNPVVGDTAQYHVIGGTVPYIAFSSNPAYAQVSTSGNTVTAMVASIPAVDTTVTISVYDATGTKKDVTLILDVPPVVPVVALTVIPATQTLASPFAGELAYYTILGGVAPYSVFSDKPAIVTAVTSGSTMTATVASVPANTTTVTFTVYDAVGTSKAVTLILDVTGGGGGGGGQMSINPTTATAVGIQNPDGSPTDNISFVLGGGSSSWSCVSNNPVVINSPGTVPVDSGTVGPGGMTGSFTVDPNAVLVTTLVTITCTDSTGVGVSATVTVNPPSFAILLNPINVVGIANPDLLASDNVTATITGGTGPYIVLSSNPALTPPGIWSFAALTPPAPFFFDTNGVGALTLVTLTAYDNTGKIASQNLTIFPQVAGVVISANKLDVVGLTGASTADDIIFTVTGGSPLYAVSLGLTCPTAFTGVRQWSLTPSGVTQLINPTKPVADETCVLTVTDANGAISTTTFVVHP